MKKSKTVLTMLVLAGLLVFSDSCFAAKGGTQGPPTDGGGGSPDLGDLVVLYRDAWGVPILTEVPDLCQQPLAAPGEEIPGCELKTSTDSCVIPVDPDTCAVVAGYEMYTQEVDFGRTSVIRSPDTVLEQSLGEVVTKLATAQCTTLDPAGRLVNSSKIDNENLSATIDSPLENLAIYWQLMRKGYLGDDADQIVLPDEVLNTAARGLGAANDKTGKVTVDQVVYTNEIMGLTDENVQTYLPKICINVREEVQGAVQQVRKCFLNYGDEHLTYDSIGAELADYKYNRTTNFGALPAPPYIPEGEGLSEEGWFEYLGLWSEPGGTTPYLFYIVQGPILDSVFCLDAGEPVVPEDGICDGNGYSIDLGFADGNIGGFTQAADDTRRVIEFTHDRPLPLGYETQLTPCDAPDTDLDYDVSISEESGLQVPTRMVAGAEEGREIIVTVSNAGPDVATGSVTVIGIDAEQKKVFNQANSFTIDGGKTYSNSYLFTLNYATTVSWTATAFAEDDLNTGNNTVTATTKVMTTVGGSGRDRPQ